MHPRKRPRAVRGEVSVDGPVLAPVVALLDEHGGRTERLERNDQVGHVELRLKVQLDRHIRLAILSLSAENIMYYS